MKQPVYFKVRSFFFSWLNGHHGDKHAEKGIGDPIWRFVA